MHRVKQFYKKHRESILYLFFGMLSMIINITVFALFHHLLGDKLYLVTNLVAWLAAVIFAFFTNKYLVFASKATDKKTLLSESGKFLLARVLSLLMEEGMLWCMLDLLNMSDLSIKFITTIDGEFIAKTITTLAVVVANYFFSKFVIFKKAKQKTQY